MTFVELDFSLTAHLERWHTQGSPLTEQPRCRPRARRNRRSFPETSLQTPEHLPSRRRPEEEGEEGSNAKECRNAPLLGTAALPAGSWRGADEVVLWFSEGSVIGLHGSAKQDVQYGQRCDQLQGRTSRWRESRDFAQAVKPPPLPSSALLVILDWLEAAVSEGRPGSSI